MFALFNYLRFGLKATFITGEIIGNSIQKNYAQGECQFNPREKYVFLFLKIFKKLKK